RGAHPTTLAYLMGFFGKSCTWISRVWNGVLEHIHHFWGRRIELDKKPLTPEAIDMYAAAIESSLGDPDELIFGFIDGTEIPICRPIEDQQLYYSGHKKQHAIAHLVIVLPDGFLGEIF
ncbi:hypothetical protein K469DRAFT_518917, partial [Zopfia rhizophila CBS 207.26]